MKNKILKIVGIGVLFLIILIILAPVASAEEGQDDQDDEEDEEVHVPSILYTHNEIVGCEIDDHPRYLIYWIIVWDDGLIESGYEFYDSLI